MFEVGFSEILLIFAIALLVLGPNRLPKLAADLGRWAGRARAMARQLRTQLEQEVQFDPLKDQPGPAKTIHSPAPAPVAEVPSPNTVPAPVAETPAPNTVPAPVAETPAPNTVPAEAAAGGSSAAAGSDAPVTESQRVADRTDEPKSA